MSGAAVLAWLLGYMSFGRLKQYISYIFLDTSHGVYTMEEKWEIYLGQIQVQMKSYIRYLVLAAGIVFSMCLIHLIVSRRIIFYKNSLKQPEKVHLTTNLWHAAAAVLVLAGILMQAKAVYAFLFEDKNQFFLQIRYMAFLLPAVVLGICCYRKMVVWFYLCIIPALVSVVAVLFVTNMDTNVTYAKAFLGVLGSLFILNQYIRDIVESSFWKRFLTGLQYAAGGMLLAGFLVCRLILIRVSGCLPVTVLAPLAKMEYGSEKGIWVLADTAEIWNDNYRELEKYISREDKVLYIGAENLIYAQIKTLPATPSTQGTTVYNEMFLYYYEEHPDRVPSVIVYDKTFGENPAYALSFSFSLQNPVLFQWIEENYGDGQRIETDHLIIIKKQ